MIKAIITGVTGQDGAYLAEYLLHLNYQVIGLLRRSSSVNDWRLKELNLLDHPNLTLVSADITDLSDMIRVIEEHQPDEIYNLAAQSFVGISFSQPLATSNITGMGPHNILEAIRILNKKIKFYQASSSEMYGKVQAIPQDESTSFYPRSPYAVSKLYAHWITVNYRESYNMFAVSGILFNHESPLRGVEFVTRKITAGVARIKYGLQSHIELGNLEAQRDWGYAKEYVEGMYKMLQVKSPDNYVLATNKIHTVRTFAEISFAKAGIHIEWQGKNQDEVGIDTATGKTVLKINPKYCRPTEVDFLIGDYTKAKNHLGWEPKTTLEDLCTLMVKHDMQRVAQELKFNSVK